MECTAPAGYSLRDAAFLATARVASLSDTLVESWSDDERAVIREVAGRQLSKSAHAAAMLGKTSERLVAGIELVPFLERGGPFGPAWANHPFASPAMGVGYRLREPDITRELAAFMGPSGGRQASRRAVTFLRVLAELAEADPILNSLTEQSRPVVAAEHPVTSGRTRSSGPSVPGSPAATRIDLLFEWPTGTTGQRAVVVIEAKLGSVVSDGQLRPYRMEAQRRAKGGPVSLILLTPWADAAERRHRSWTAIRWFQLLRRWERALAEAGDHDPEFARVRAHLWRFVLSNRRAQL